MKSFTIVGIVAVIIIGLQLGYLIQGPREFSDIENRDMELFPKITFQGFFSGEFQTRIEAALKDQVIKREEMVSFSSSLKGRSRHYYNQICAFFFPKHPMVVATDDMDDSMKLTDPASDTVKEYSNEINTNQSNSTLNATVTPEGGFNQSTANPGVTSSTEGTAVVFTPTPKPTNIVSQSTGKAVPTTSPTGKIPGKPTPTPRSTPVSNSPSPIPASQPFQYVLNPVGAMYTINDTGYMTEYPNLETAENKNNVNVKLNQYAEMLRLHPDMKLFVYYVTKAADLNWFDQSEGIKAFNAGEYISSMLPENIRFKQLKFSNLDEYKEGMFKTDHHWSAVGSYRGYTEIYQMLNQDFNLSEMKRHGQLLDFGGLMWVGTRGKKSGVSVPPEPFTAYEYEYDSHTTYIGNSIREEGMMEQYKAGTMDRDILTDHYKVYFGNDEARNVIRYEFPANPNKLLIIGDSNTKPIRKLIASHFGTTVFLDYRVLDFTKVENIIKQYNISNVLVITQYIYWFGPQYNFLDYPINSQNPQWS